MEPTRELVDAIYRDRVLRARRTPPEEKVRDGPRLFDMACRIAADGIRHSHPDADDAQILETLKRRIRFRERMENGR